MIGRSFYDSTTSEKLPEHKIELWNGYNTEIHNVECGSMLRITTSTTILRTETCLNYIGEL
jgi:aubergine-like protein